MTIAPPPANDRTPAANMQSSRRFLEQAALELAKEPPERLPASEKCWGALIQGVKAVAKDRRWRNDSHYRTHAILNQIIYEQGEGTRPTPAAIPAPRWRPESGQSNAGWKG